MSDRIPYTYLIRCKSTGQFYYGLKYGKGADPKAFWKKYFTSSAYVAALIERYGKDDFETEIRRIFDCPKQARKWEQRVLQKIIKWPGCLNVGVGGDAIKSHEKKMLIGSDGLNSYQRAGRKLGQRLATDSELLKQRSQSRTKTMSAIGDDGLTGFQRACQKNKGKNNPSCKKENREKISASVNTWREHNAEAVAEQQRKSSEARLKIGSDGLTCHERHSIFMKEHCQAIGTVWITDGTRDQRWKGQELPEGWTIGRTNGTLAGHKYELTTCPYCGKVGSGGNMKRFHFDNCKEIK